MSSKPMSTLDTFPNPASERSYTIEFECPEFTCVCPKTSQPDFATIHVRYVPGDKCIELKSLKLYLWGYREVGAFHEAVTNKIANDIIEACDPRFLEVKGVFKVRGGIYTNVIVQHGDAALLAAGGGS